MNIHFHFPPSILFLAGQNMCLPVIKPTIVEEKHKLKLDKANWFNIPPEEPLLKQTGAPASHQPFYSGIKSVRRQSAPNKKSPSHRARN